MKKDIRLEKILMLLEEQYKKEPAYFVGSSILRARLDMATEELRPYIELLAERGYVDKLEGLSSCFITKLTNTGHSAVMHNTFLY
ncbi:MAG: hypothetical protein ACXQS3_04315 [Candidatus Methanofastidiosia archaeon]